MLGIDEKREDNIGFPKHRLPWLLLCLYKTIKKIVCLLCAHLCQTLGNSVINMTLLTSPKNAFLLSTPKAYWDEVEYT